MKNSALTLILILACSQEIIEKHNQPHQPLTHQLDPFFRIKNAAKTLLNPFLALLGDATTKKISSMFDSKRISDLILEQIEMKSEAHLEIPVSLLMAAVYEFLIEVPIKLDTQNMIASAREFEIVTNTETLGSFFKQPLPKMPIAPVINFHTFYAPTLTASSCPGSLYTNSNSSCITLLVGIEFQSDSIELMANIDFELKLTNNFTRIFVNSIYVEKYSDKGGEQIYIEKVVDFTNDALQLAIGALNNWVTGMVNHTNQRMKIFCNQFKVVLSSDLLSFKCT